MTFSSFYNTVPLENVSTNDVVIGRGRRIKEHPGNVRFQSIIQENLEGYASAVTKTKKSLIILKILNEVQGSGGNFVKLDSGKTGGGQPVEVEESQARITIAQALRDCLNQHYKSSRQHKQRKRLQLKRATATAHYINQAMARAAASGSGSALDSLNLNTSLSQLMLQNSTTNAAIQPLPASSFNSFCNGGKRSTSSTSLSTCSTATSSTSSSSSTPTDTLNDIVNEALQAAQKVPSSTTQVQVQAQQEVVTQEEVLMDDLFTSLFKAYSTSATSSSSPFEPTPLATNTSTITTTPEETTSSSLREMMMLMEPTPLPEEETSSFGSLEEDWEPFPLFA